MDEGSSTPVEERLASGDEGLDAILGGGLPAGTINLIMGRPGAGKTILCQQLVFANATAERPAAYFSTVSEPFDKVIRYGQSLAFFDRRAVGRSVFYDDLGALVAEEGLGAVIERVGAAIRERRPGIVAIDSFKALAPFAGGPREFRRFLHELAALLTAYPATALWVGEYSEEDVREAPELAVADAILYLGSERGEARTARSIQVLKLRGSDFRSGRHAYRLSERGMAAFPRLSDPRRGDEYALASGRMSSGVPALDAMLAEGYWPGASTLVAGPSGAGKTLLGLHFIFGGAAAGEPGVVATLQENPTQLERVANGFGWSLHRDGVELMYRSPNGVYLDEWTYDLLARVEEVGARRVMIDSLTDLQHAAPDAVRFRELCYSLTQRLARAGVGSVMTSEIPDLFHVGRLAEGGISHLADNVVLLQYVRGEGRVDRSLTVLKSRASGHDPEIRRFEISTDGIAVGAPVAGAPAAR